MAEMEKYLKENSITAEDLIKLHQASKNQGTAPEGVDAEESSEGSEEEEPAPDITQDEINAYIKAEILAKKQATEAEKAKASGSELKGADAIIKRLDAIEVALKKVKPAVRKPPPSGTETKKPPVELTQNKFAVNMEQKKAGGK